MDKKIQIEAEILSLIELDSYFISNFKEYESSDMEIEISLELDLDHYAEENFWNEWKQEIDTFCEKLKTDYNLETDFLKVKCIIYICVSLSEIVEIYRGYSKLDLRKVNQRTRQENRLIAFIKNIPNECLEKFSRIPIPGLKSMQLNLAKEKPIVIENSLLISEILSMFKNSNSFYERDYLTKTDQVTKILYPTAKMLHKYFADNSNLIVKEGKETSNEICRLIYDIFLFCNLLSKNECDNTTPENNIRIMILRSKFS